MPLPAAPLPTGPLALLLLPVGLSVAELRVLLRALLPLPVFDPAALAWLADQQRRKVAAYRSHRRRRLRRLAARST